MWHSRLPRDPPPFMAKTILNFHFDYWNPSLMIVLILTQPPSAQLSPLAGVLSNLLFFKSLLGTIFLS